MDNKYLVSAIVSVYNCERFISGCLEDLEQQTIADKLEIVVVNSGSQQNEEAIIKTFQEKYKNIVYIKTDNRETIYQAWNRGIKSASGKYITNANSDDRHRKDAFEVMVNVLENEEDISLVYADNIRTEIENEIFDDNIQGEHSIQPEFSRNLLLLDCYIGPQPMWRRSVHEEFGYFDENLRVAGDREFWLRISKKCKFKHIKDYLGLFLEIKSSAWHRDFETTFFEREKVRDAYMKIAANDKKLMEMIKKRRTVDLFDLGYIYFKKASFLLARKAFIRSISYDWNNFKSYWYLLLCFIPEKILKILRLVKHYLMKTHINDANKLKYKTGADASC